MFLFSPSLSLVPTLSFDPKERKGSLSLALSFSLQAAEREAEDIPGHMGFCGGALMTEWDAIHSYCMKLGVYSFDVYTLIHR